jgi:tRNA-2-methylthio-N6-dimethylallyladenosine synthase
MSATAKVYIETMGCQMNALDSELVRALVRSGGMELTDDPRAADVLLYNTCSVRGHAEEKAISHIGSACQRKSAGKHIVIGVLGCMAQRMGAELLRRYPGVDIVCGPNQLPRLAELIAARLAGTNVAQPLSAGESHVAQPPPAGGPTNDGILALDPERVSRPNVAQPPSTGESHVAYPPSAGGPHEAQPGVRLRRMPHVSWALDELEEHRDPGRTHLPGQAYVRIMRGCDKFCAYCVVPYVRGREQSRPPESIRAEVARLVDGGITQVTLLGQTVNSYRHVAGDRTTTLADLLELLEPLPGLRRLRFVTSYPAGFDRRILTAMRDLPKVCRYLHVPAQSGSDRLLKAMNRHYLRAEYEQLIADARAIVPGIAVAGDFIVGFPGETDEDHAASADLIRRCRYKNSFIFKYSPRPGTLADKRLPDDIPEAVKKRRNRELLAVQSEISLADNRALIGQTVEVLVEGPSPRSRKQPTPETQMLGRTTTDHIVCFTAPTTLAGQYVSVRIHSASALALIGAIEP